MSIDVDLSNAPGPYDQPTANGTVAPPSGPYNYGGVLSGAAGPDYRALLKRCLPYAPNPLKLEIMRALGDAP